MSYHIIDISTTGVSIFVKDRQLICRNPDSTEHKLPMEDIGAVLINSFSATLHTSFLTSAAENKVAVIVCDKFKPVSMVLPVQRATDTILTRAQIQMPTKELLKMWTRTIDAKCANQYELVSRIANDEDNALRNFRLTMAKEDIGKEGNCARLYWGLFSGALEMKGFRRFRDGDGLNGMLNYGYAVLLLRVEQKLLACGLDPLYGMGHYPKERSMPLAYDVMEPFRPIVDEMIYNWIKGRDTANRSEVLAVNVEYKRYMQTLMSTRHKNNDADDQCLDDILEQVIRSFRMALTTGNEREYKPWIRRNSRWAG